MSPAARALRQTLTIARRDFIATVATPIFLIFLMAPIIMGSFSAVAGLGAASAAGGSGGGASRSRIVAIVPEALARPMAEADTRLRALYLDEGAPPDLLTLAPHGDPAAQARAAFDAKDYEPSAVMYGPLTAPTILALPDRDRAVAYLTTLAGAVLTDRALGAQRPHVAAHRIAFSRDRGSASGQNRAAYLAVFGIFFLTFFLAGQMTGMMAEERNNKVIEVLAAAVPLESVFLGKLIGMFGVAVLFVSFWGVIASGIGALLPPEVMRAIGSFSPAVGLPAFIALFLAYFAMAYLVLGAIFLSIGAQAQTVREIQLLALPIAIVQIGCFTLASIGAGRPDSTIATIAAIFPLSSPFAMAGRAVNDPAIWPHVAALVWQLFWVALIVRTGARLFRRGVLQSGSAAPRRGRAVSSA